MLELRRSSDLCQSPARKRQRLSPEFDECFENLSQEDLAALDEIEARHSHGSQSPSKNAQSARRRSEKAIADALTVNDREKENIAIKIPTRAHSKSFPNTVTVGSPSNGHVPKFAKPRDDPDNPFIAQLPSFASAKSVIIDDAVSSSKFTSAIQFCSDVSFQEDQCSSSPEIPPERDYSAWFAPEPPLPVGFQPANFATASSIPVPAAQVPMVGFMKASKKGWAVPSDAALMQAEEKMKQIWQEEDAECVPPPVLVGRGDVSIEMISDPTVSQRPVLRAVQNSFPSHQPPDSPSPASFGRPTVSHNQIIPSFSTASSGFDQAKGKGKVKPFKSPLMIQSASKPFHSPVMTSSTVASSPLNPNRLVEQSFVSAGSQHAFFSTPVADSPLSARIPPQSSTFVTPVRPLGVTSYGPRETPAKVKFITPFKVGMKPGEPGRKALIDTPAKPTKPTTTMGPKDSNFTNERQPHCQNIYSTNPQETQRWKAFNISKPLNRQTLVSSGLVPQSYDSDDLEAMGINAAELSQISPNLALYYSFHTSSVVPLETNPTGILGPSEALEELRSRGCSLVTKPWVDNHWSLILWKLAGMVYLDPEKEHDPKTKVWCWSEVIRQLLYRYERELNSGSRPPLRLVATQDKPASLPMVLCVSNVTWSEARITEDGSPVIPHPELELTDGWYRLRAQVDQPLARAIRRGAIRVGRKIAVAAARLWSERKEPTEILEAYNSTKLVISGNSSHLAPWHAKLGFQMGVSIATLNSLTPDGGVVAVMDVVVLKIYPIAYIEFIEAENGQVLKEGPRNESEEASLNDRWKRRREAEASKLYGIFENKLRQFENYTDRLQRQAGGRFQPREEDSPPDHIETLLGNLEETPDNSASLSRLTSEEAGWLARLIREKIDNDREKAGEEIEQELKSICPPREVRNFRVLSVQDACTQRRHANRIAQLTVWDVLNLRLSEESDAGKFEVGQRFRVTNLIPTQRNAWMDRGRGSEVYLSSRRDTRWTRMK